jgi:hypothetical protein
MNCVRNIDLIGIRRKSIIQLVFVPRLFPDRFRANTALGVWQREASTDGSSFEADTSLTFKEAASSSEGYRSNLRIKRKKELENRRPHRRIIESKVRPTKE